jgi:hypothetical protein
MKETTKAALKMVERLQQQKEMARRYIPKK